MIKFKRIKSLGRRCFGSLGRFLRHPKTVGFIIRILGSVLVWVLKKIIVALLLYMGIALSDFL